MNDPHWDQTVLLLHCDGENGSSYFCDERHNIVTVNGDARISTAQKMFGTSSAYFDGAGDFLSIASSSSLDLGTGDFTIEAFVRASSIGGEKTLIAKRPGGSATQRAWVEVWMSSAGAIEVGIASNSSTWGLRLSSSSVIPLNDWVHVAVVRESGTVTLYMKGVAAASGTYAGVVHFDSAALYIGSETPSLYPWHGYIDEIRITNGVGRYAEDFTPPTTPFPDARRRGDPLWPSVVLSLPFDAANGSAVFFELKGKSVMVFGDTKHSNARAKFHGSSAYFDGSGDYLLLADSADWHFGADDFTIEGWINLLTHASQRPIFAQGSVSGSTFSHSLYVNANGALIASFSTSGTGQTHQIASASGTVPTNAWKHIAVSRAGATMRMFVDGAAVGSVNVSGASFFNSTASLAIGGNDVGVFYGYMDNLRVTKGGGRYIANFTPPTEPFPIFVPEQLSGVVLDADGHPISRTVRSYERGTGHLIGTAVSDPETGVFSLPADSTDEHFVMIFDDAKNALVYDHITPVAA